ncbi:hypothetical protein KY285_023067 [Solanum tuberosum]|nr:hypothetical protein KY285_023067 [Solanum tuberosum]
MGLKLFDVPISVSNSMLSSKCDCKRRRINEVTIMEFSEGDYGGNSLKIANQAHFPILHLPHPVDLVSEDDDLYGVGGFDKTNLKLIGSCNGFICLLHGETYEVDHLVWISNPLLGEYFKVKLPEREKRICHIHYGFCFSEASGQYKVLRLVTRKFRDRPDVSQLEVYTLGGDEKNWRNVGKAPKPLRGKLSDANVNGTIHWLGDKNLQKSASIYSFNIATEEVKSLPAPSGLDTPSLRQKK